MARFLGGRVFDARPDRVDFRDRPYQPPLRSLPPRWPLDPDVKRLMASFADRELVLDQGEEGACTGFGLACVINYLRWTRAVQAGGEAARKAAFSKASPYMLYQLARRYDEWPGERYEGSSCRGALKGWHKHGVCSDKRWPDETPRAGWEEEAADCPLGVYYRVDRRSLVDMQSAVAEIGAIYVSAAVHDGWDDVAHARRTPTSHEALPRIPLPKTSERGGHAFAIIGYNEHGFIVQNSWGGAWGAAGFAVLPYADWVEHGDDAWVAALGVPVRVNAERRAAMRWPVRSGRSLGSHAHQAQNPENPAEDPWPVDHKYAYKEYQPWSTAQAYEHTLVTGNDGCIEVSDLLHDLNDTRSYARHIAYELPLKQLKDHPAPRLMVYAHGGLNAEAESIDRIRMLAPYFGANGIYPLFLTWKTGPIEVLLQMFEDLLRPKLDVEAAFAAGAVRDQLDRLAERLGRVFLRGIWTEMRENALRGLKADHGLDQIGGNLAQLRKDLRALEVHFVGHSAGAILLGHLLTLFSGIASCSLFAPACSVRFACERYLPAAAGGLPFTVRVLSDRNEKEDALPTPKVELYGKSLLYFVSRALDDVRKMPLLGFERAARPGYEKNPDQWEAEELPQIQAWLKAFKGSVVAESRQRVPVSAHGHTIQATHGSFDNNVDVVTDTIARIAGKPPIKPVEWLDY